MNGRNPLTSGVGLSGETPDEVIWEYAKQNGFLIVTRRCRLPPAGGAMRHTAAGDPVGTDGLLDRSGGRTHP